MKSEKSCDNGINKMWQKQLAALGVTTSEDNFL